MAKHVRQDGLTASRVYGSVCPKHPELEGLRQKPTVKKYLNADCEVVTYLLQGKCIGCAREKDAARGGETLHFGMDEKFGAVWRDLSDAIRQWGYAYEWFYNERK